MSIGNTGHFTNLRFRISRCLYGGFIVRTTDDSGDNADACFRFKDSFARFFCIHFIDFNLFDSPGETCSSAHCRHRITVSTNLKTTVVRSPGAGPSCIIAIKWRCALQIFFRVSVVLSHYRLTHLNNFVVIFPENPRRVCPSGCTRQPFWRVYRAVYFRYDRRPSFIRVRLFHSRRFYAIFRMIFKTIFH